MSADTGGDRKQSLAFPSWLRRSEQILWLLCLSAMIAGIGFSLLKHHARSKQFIEIEDAPAESAEFVVDINRADWPELCVLPRISETSARRIVDFRNRNGDFRTLEDLLRVPGIGTKTLEGLRPFLTITLESTSATKIQDQAAEDPMRLR